MLKSWLAGRSSRLWLLSVSARWLRLSLATSINECHCCVVGSCHLIHTDSFECCLSAADTHVTPISNSGFTAFFSSTHSTHMNDVYELQRHEGRVSAQSMNERHEERQCVDERPVSGGPRREQRLNESSISTGQPGVVSVTCDVCLALPDSYSTSKKYSLL